MDLIDAGVVTNRAAIPLERRRELIGVEQHRVEAQRARADRAVSRGIFGVGPRDDEVCPRRIRFGFGVAIGVGGTATYLKPDSVSAKAAPWRSDSDWRKDTRWRRTPPSMLILSDS
jgi:hypothetical protein